METAFASFPEASEHARTQAVEEAVVVALELRDDSWIAIVPAPDVSNEKYAEAFAFYEWALRHELMPDVSANDG